MTKTPTGSRKSSSSSSSSSRRNYFLSYSSIVFFVVAVVARSAGIGEDCETAFLGRFDGDEISGAGSGFDTSGDWSNSDRVTRGEEECQELCRTQRQAKAWRLRWHGQPGCTCLKTMTGKDQDQEGLAFRSGKFCTCLLSFNDHVVNVASFSISSFCTSPLGDVAATSRLPNDAVCNLTCDGSYVGAPGAVRCRAGDLGVVGDRAALEPAPDCVLNRTSIFYASVGGGLAALLVLFLVAICCVRRRQNRRHREKYGDGVDGVDGGGESGARGVVAFRPAADGSAEVTEGAVDRRKSYKAATGHGSVDEGSHEDDLMLNRRGEIVYANPKSYQPSRTEGRRPIIGNLDPAEPVYLDGSLQTRGDEEQYANVGGQYANDGRQYASVDRKNNT